MALAQALPFGICISLIHFNMNHINSCPSCIHRNNCVLTMQKDKVWSCSDYDQDITESSILEPVQNPQENLKQKIELV